MSEIEKLMQNAKVKKYRLLDKDNKLKWVYPEFTAEKQLEILEFILIRNIEIRLIMTSNSHKYYISSFGDISILSDKLSVTIASFINNLWQDLTDTEKAEIKRILE